MRTRCATFSFELSKKTNITETPLKLRYDDTLRAQLDPEAGRFHCPRCEYQSMMPEDPVGQMTVTLANVTHMISHLQDVHSSQPKKTSRLPASRDDRRLSVGDQQFSPSQKARQ